MTDNGNINRVSRTPNDCSSVCRPPMYCVPTRLMTCKTAEVETPRIAPVQCIPVHVCVSWRRTGSWVFTIQWIIWLSSLTRYALALARAWVISMTCMRHILEAIIPSCPLQCLHPGRGEVYMHLMKTTCGGDVAVFQLLWPHVVISDMKKISTSALPCSVEISGKSSKHCVKQ